MRILLVEDDPMIGDSLQTALRQSSHAVNWVKDGHLAEAALAMEPYDLMLLDLGLPKKSGIEVLRQLRATGNTTPNNNVPVIIITARDAVSDRVAGLDHGADDYLIKPFALEELDARIRAAARRRGGRAEPLLVCGTLSLNPATREVTYAGKTQSLSAREYGLLFALMERPGNVLSRAQLEERLYGWNEEIASNAVEVHVHQLRKKLGVEVIRTIRGLGYMVPPAL